MQRTNFEENENSRKRKFLQSSIELDTFVTSSSSARIVQALNTSSVLHRTSSADLLADMALLQAIDLPEDFFELPPELLCNPEELVEPSPLSTLIATPTAALTIPPATLEQSDFDPLVWQAPFTSLLPPLTLPPTTPLPDQDASSSSTSAQDTEVGKKRSKPQPENCHERWEKEKLYYQKSGQEVEAGSEVCVVGLDKFVNSERVIGSLQFKRRHYAYVANDKELTDEEKMKIKSINGKSYVDEREVYEFTYSKIKPFLHKTTLPSDATITYRFIYKANQSLNNARVRTFP